MNVISSKADFARFAVPIALISTAFFAGTLLIAKALGQEGIVPFQVSAARFQFGFLAVLTYSLIRFSEFPNFTDVPWGLHISRSVSGWLGATCMFAAAIFMPIGEATAISFLNPLVAMALAAIFLKEGLNFTKYLAAFFGILGTLLILRPGVEALQPAAIFAIGAAIFLGVEAIFIKRLSDQEPVLRILLINNFVGALVATPVALFVWQWPSGYDWSLMILLGVIMVSGQAMFVRAMSLGEASQISPVLYAVLVFAALYDFLFYGEVLSLWSMLGSASIIVGAVLLSFSTKKA